MSRVFKTLGTISSIAATVIAPINPPIAAALSAPSPTMGRVRPVRK